MRHWHPLTKLTVAVGLVAIPLAWFTSAGGDRVRVAEARIPDGGMPAVSGEPGSSSGASLPALRQQLPPLDSFEAVVERPLFTASRRPTPAPVPAPVVETVQEEPEVELRLIGTVRARGLLYGLLVVETDEGVRRVRRGDEVEGWTVAEVTADAIRLDRDGREQVLEILR